MPMITFSIWIGLYTFNLFATRPFEENSNSEVDNCARSPEPNSPKEFKNNEYNVSVVASTQEV